MTWPVHAKLESVASNYVDTSGSTWAPWPGADIVHVGGSSYGIGSYGPGDPAYDVFEAGGYVQRENPPVSHTYVYPPPGAIFGSLCTFRLPEWPDTDEYTIEIHSSGVVTYDASPTNFQTYSFVIDGDTVSPYRDLGYPFHDILNQTGMVGQLDFLALPSGGTADVVQPDGSVITTINFHPPRTTTTRISTADVLAGSQAAGTVWTPLPTIYDIKAYPFGWSAGSGITRLRQRQSLAGTDSWPLQQRQNGAATGSWPLRQRQRAN